MLCQHVCVEGPLVAVWSMKDIELNTFIFSNIRVHRAIIIHTCLNNHWAITRIKTRIPEKSLAYLAGFPIDILNGQCEIIGFSLKEV